MYRSNEGISFTTILNCAPISRISPAEDKNVYQYDTQAFRKNNHIARNP